MAASNVAPTFVDMNRQVLGIYGNMFTKSHNQFDSHCEQAELREELYQCVYHAKLWQIKCMYILEVGLCAYGLLVSNVVRINLETHMNHGSLRCIALIYTPLPQSLEVYC